VGKTHRLFLIQKILRAKAMDYHWKIFEGQDGQTYVNIKHVNGQTLYTSEGYTTRKAAVETLENFLRAVRRVNATTRQIVARYSVSSTDVQS
jgi:uncharacterized protein YegP (UPF0339 family)